MDKTKKTVILFKCIYIDEDVISEFENLKRSCGKRFDIFLSYDNSRKDLKVMQGIDYHIYDLEKIKRLGYRFYPTDENILWYNSDYSVLDFFREKDYSFYWVIDYDVRFSGDWNIFFNHFSKSDSDLVAINIKKIEDNSNYVFRDNIILTVQDYEKFSSFLCIYRLSRSALEFLDTKYREGCSGYCEVIIPTLLNIGKYKMENIPQNYATGETVKFRPMMEKVGALKNKIYHPIRSKHVQSFYESKYKSKNKFLLGIKSH